MAAGYYGSLLNILYEDADILVCVKPAGTASETKKAGVQDMASLVRNYRHEKGEEPYAGLVHRLDQPVEGILVFGKHQKSTAALSRQLARESFTKIYLAVTEGSMPQREGKLEDYLKKDGRRNVSYPAEKGDAGAKKAVLFYEVLKTDAGGPVQNLVKIRLVTGRHHQIRVQLAHHGAPLAGDAKYGLKAGGTAQAFAGTGHAGSAAAGACQAPDGKGSGLGLCACELRFLHPATGKEMRFAVRPSQPVFQKLLKETLHRNM